MKKPWRESIDDPKYSYQIPKARQATEASKRDKRPDYEVGSKVYVKKSLFMDAYSKSPRSEKLSRSVGTCNVKELIGKNDVRLDLPGYFRIHSAIYASHTIPYVHKPKDIGQQKRPERSTTVLGNEYEVKKILVHRKRGGRYQFLTSMKGEPVHDSKWHLSSDFVDNDGTVTDAWFQYIGEKDILPMIHGNDKKEVIDLLTRTSISWGGDMCNEQHLD